MEKLPSYVGICGKIHPNVGIFTRLTWRHPYRSSHSRLMFQNSIPHIVILMWFATMNGFDFKPGSQEKILETQPPAAAQEIRNVTYFPSRPYFCSSSWLQKKKSKGTANSRASRAPLKEICRLEKMLKVPCE